MNDERPIEKLLRRYAKKRRDDASAPVKLHPATRRMLQGEVARRFPRPASPGDREPTTFTQILIGWRTRLIWAVPVVVVLGVGLWALVGTHEKAGDRFRMAQESQVTAAPGTPPAVVAESFQAWEADKVTSPAPVASPSSPPTLAYAKRDAVLETPARSSTQEKLAEDKFAVSMADGAVRRKESEEATISSFAATTPTEPQLTLESGRVAAHELARAATPPESRSPTLATKRPLAEPTSATGDEQIKTLGLTLAASPKPGLDHRLDSVPKGDLSGVRGLEANKPGAIAPDASGRYYRQSSGGSSDRNNAQVYSQAFANRVPAASSGAPAKSVTVTSVLAKFQVEQSGTQLRVIDGDGSTYVGDLNTPVAATVGKDELKKKAGGTPSLRSGAKSAAPPASAAVALELQRAQNYGYRVAGTNRTLNQQVVFTWNFVEGTNGLAAAQTKIPPGGGNVRLNNLPAQQLPMLPNNSRISGRAQLNGGKEIEINAEPVTR